MKQSKNYYSSKLKLVGLLIGSVAFVAIFISMLSEPQGSLSFKAQLIAWIGLPCFSFAAVLSIYLLINRRPIVAITETALIVSGFPPVKWDEISSAYIFEYYNNKYLGIKLKDKESFTNKLSPIRRLLLRLPKAKDWPLVSIGQAILPEPIETLLADINAKTDAP